MDNAEQKQEFHEGWEYDRLHADLLEYRWLSNQQILVRVQYLLLFPRLIIMVLL